MILTSGRHSFIGKFMDGVRAQSLFTRTLLRDLKKFDKKYFHIFSNIKIKLSFSGSR
jgi:hypothetical protein